MEDKQIIQLYRSSPDKAFSILVRKHQEPLYWYIRKSVVSHDDTNDIIQNTFKNAWSAFSKFEGKSSISTWLHKIATNEMYAHLRKNNRISYDSEQVEKLLSNEKTQGYFSGNDAEEKLAIAVASLPDRQREVFNLKYFQERSYKEISEIMGGTVGSHKASFHHAKDKIKKIISRSLNLLDL